MRTNGRGIVVGTVVKLDTHAMKRRIFEETKKRVGDKKEMHGRFTVCEIAAGHATLQSTRGRHVTVPKDILIPIPN